MHKVLLPKSSKESKRLALFVHLVRQARGPLRWKVGVRKRAPKKPGKPFEPA